MTKPLDRREDGSVIRRPKTTVLEVVVRVRVEQDGIDPSCVAFNLGPGLMTYRGVSRQKAERLISAHLKKLVTAP